MDWSQVFYTGSPGLLRTMAAAVFAYGSMTLVLRMAGKHALSKLHVFDYVVTVALGSTLASILLSEDVALAEGLVAVIMLIGMQWLVSKASVSFEPWRRFVRSDPAVLLRHGELDAEAMISERVTEVEVDIAIRMRGFGDRSLIAYVVLESDGSMSVIPRDLLGDASAMHSLDHPREPEEAKRRA
ncbi:DUF421 domain-containing protein [Alteriqipengyuania lutimaris]|uniref:DUF421 domain-containing protein n=1 Tax=Alteriqipengyuania lutimaris TaxID=1538146 RepID=A0A395LP53_9SPHN|nr:YetF domain-containing protein [Alteriqipengyuania lutimaris]MBB3032679.1 uncharacterized membrane protein YcaP (DUF421 family) [Alteriqipengyuania lutimaris]RDS78207.1 DUF421 domain-containing protein [Alteriqipengyuania lutimaris]